VDSSPGWVGRPRKHSFVFLAAWADGPHLSLARSTGRNYRPLLILSPDAASSGYGDLFLSPPTPRTSPTGSFSTGNDNGPVPFFFAILHEEGGPAPTATASHHLSLFLVEMLSFLMEDSTEIFPFFFFPLSLPVQPLRSAAFRRSVLFLFSQQGEARDHLGACGHSFFFASARHARGSADGDHPPCARPSLAAPQVPFRR